MKQIQHKRPLGQKLIASFVFIAFSLSTLTYSNPTLFAQSLQGGKAQHDPHSPVAAQSPSEFLASLSLPVSLGTLDRSYKGESKNLVVLIQDAHAIGDAQKSIQKMISHLHRHHGLAQVGLEGSSVRLDPTFLQAFPDKNKLEQVMNDYFERGELSGAVVQSILEDHNIAYQGIEDKSLYTEGIEAFLKAYKQGNLLQSKFKVLQKDLSILKQKFYSKKIQTLDRLLQTWRQTGEGIFDLFDFFKNEGYEVKKEIYPHLAAIADQLSKNLESQNHQHEIQMLAEQVLEQLTEKEDIKLWNKKSQNYQTEHLSKGDYALFLLDLAKKNQQTASLSEGLQKLVRQARVLSQISGKKFIEEFENFIQSLFDKNLKTENAKVVYQVSNRINLLEKTIELKLSRSQWKQIQTESRRLESKTAEVQKIINEINSFEQKVHRSGSFTDFYQNAIAREQALVQKLKAFSNQNLVAMIVGGFHTEGIEEELQKSGDSYVVLTPAIEQMPEQNFYTDYMQGQVSWKDYFEVSKGRIDLYEAFMRATRDQLLENPKPYLLKQWRDHLIHKLAKQNRLRDANQYTRFIDETITGKLDPKKKEALKQAWLDRVKQFLSKAKGLHDQNKLNPENVLNLANAPATQFSIAVPIPFESYNHSLVLGQVSPRSALNLNDSRRLREKPDVSLRSEVRANEQTVIISSREEILAMPHDERYKTYIERMSPQRGSLPTIPTTLAVSDIHGRDEILSDILESHRYQPVIQNPSSGAFYYNSLVLLGDYWGNEGSNVTVMKKMQSLVESGQAVAHWGNREVVFLRAMLGDDEAMENWLRKDKEGHNLLRELEIKHPKKRKDYAQIRENETLRGYMEWFQEHLQLFHIDDNLTFFIHGGMPVDKNGKLNLKYKEKNNIEALLAMEEQLRKVTDPDDPIFDLLLQKNSVLSSNLRRLSENLSANDRNEMFQTLGVLRMASGDTPRNLGDHLDIVHASGGRFYGLDFGMKRLQSDPIPTTDESTEGEDSRPYSFYRRHQTDLSQEEKISRLRIQHQRALREGGFVTFGKSGANYWVRNSESQPSTLLVKGFSLFPNDEVRGRWANIQLAETQLAVFENNRSEVRVQTFAEEHFPQLIDYTIYGRQMEAGFPKDFLDDLEADQGAEVANLVSQTTLTGGLGALMPDLYEAWKANGIPVVGLHPIWENVKNTPGKDPLLGRYVRAFFEKRDKKTEHSFQVKLRLSEKFKQAAYARNSSVTEMFADNEQGHRDIFVQVYRIEMKTHKAPQYYLDAYHLNDDGQEVRIFDEVYSDDNLRRDFHLAVYAQATQTLIQRLEGSEDPQKVILLDNEVFTSLPARRLPSAKLFTINHTVFRPGLYEPSRASYELLDFPEWMWDSIVKDKQISIADFAAEHYQMITGVGLIEHLPALHRNIFPTSRHKLRGWNQDERRSTNGVFLPRWQSSDRRNLIERYKEKVKALDQSYATALENGYGLPEEATDKVFFRILKQR